MDLKILTYNIAHGVGLDGKLDVKRQAELIKEYSPDIACIQEIDVYSKRTNQIDEISIMAEKLDFDYSAMGTTLTIQDGYYGNGILSKYPIIYSMNYLFPKNNYTYEQRGCLYSKIKKDNKLIHLFCLHLSVYEEERIIAIEKLVELIKKIDKNEYIFVAGDFNVGIEKIGEHKYKVKDDEIQHEEFEVLKKYLNKINNSNLTWFSKTGKACIDTIFYSSNIKNIDFKTIENDYSDHSAIVAEFNI